MFACHDESLWQPIAPGQVADELDAAAVAVFDLAPRRRALSWPVDRIGALGHHPLQEQVRCCLPQRFTVLIGRRGVPGCSGQLKVLQERPAFDLRTAQEQGTVELQHVEGHEVDRRRWSLREETVANRVEIRPPVAAEDHEFPVQQQGTTNSVGQAGQLGQLSGDDPTRAAAHRESTVVAHPDGGTHSVPLRLKQPLASTGQLPRRKQHR